MSSQLVTLENIDECMTDLLLESEYGMDTETYGKMRSDKMFSLQMATENNEWYFNFLDYMDDTPVLDKAYVLQRLKPIITDKNKLWYIHNSKFDQRRLALENQYYLEGEIHCTQMCERFIYNEHMHYSLDACLQRMGLEKDDAVEEYINEHQLWTIVNILGKNEKIKHYDKVPFPIMFKYGCYDARNVRLLGKKQRAELMSKVFYHSELQLQKAVFHMEERGVYCDTDYAQRGLDYEKSKAIEVADELSSLANEPFRNGPTWLRNTFDKFEVKYACNPKTGNPIFDKEALAKIDHPIANLIKQHRHHEQYANTYYGYYALRDVIHANVKMGGTKTNRFSYEDPNLQNVPKEKKLDASFEFQVRSCFKPRSKDHVFVPIDYNQQEFRMFLDYCAEHTLIRKINDHGLDAHDATAELVGIERDPAKTVNFALIYGVGDEELAKMLGLTLRETKDLKRLYFDRIPNANRLLEAIKKRSIAVGYIETWCKRRMYLPPAYYDREKKKRITFEYKMPNRLIQGGCADVIRMAMPHVHEILRQTPIMETSYGRIPRSGMAIQVHDELLLEMHKDDLYLIDPVVEIMENTYKPFNNMRLTCGIDHSWKSWGKRDIVAGKPVLQEAG